MIMVLLELVLHYMLVIDVAWFPLQTMDISIDRFHLEDIYEKHFCQFKV